MPKLSKLSVLSLLAPFAAAAQIAPVTNTPVPLSKALVFPNYDNVLVGKEQAIEGGAYIARVSDPSANFYNPAGLVQAEKVALNASSTGYVYTSLSSKLSNTSISSSKLDNLPGYIGLVSNVPFTDTRNVRLGVSITRAVSWSPGPIDHLPGGLLGLRPSQLLQRRELSDAGVSGRHRMGACAGSIIPSRLGRGDRADELLQQQHGLGGAEHVDG